MSKTEATEKYSDRAVAKTKRRADEAWVQSPLADLCQSIKVWKEGQSQEHGHRDVEPSHLRDGHP